MSLGASALSTSESESDSQTQQSNFGTFIEEPLPPATLFPFSSPTGVSRLSTLGVAPHSSHPSFGVTPHPSHPSIGVTPHPSHPSIGITPHPPLTGFSDILSGSHKTAAIKKKLAESQNIADSIYTDGPTAFFRHNSPNLQLAPFYHHPRIRPLGHFQYPYNPQLLGFPYFQGGYPFQPTHFQGFNPYFAPIPAQPFYGGFAPPLHYPRVLPNIPFATFPQALTVPNSPKNFQKINNPSTTT